MYNYPFKLQKVINEISKLPGVGPKMAERIGLYMLKQAPGEIDSFKEALEGIKTIILCPRCFNVSEEGECGICRDERRDPSLICVVESPEDIITLERTEKFSGIYHVLHGLINPLNNILPENLKLKELSERVKNSDGKVKEVVLALNHTVEGDATSFYIDDFIKKAGNPPRLTRLAKGLPTGSDIRYADEVTLGQAITERKEI